MHVSATASAEFLCFLICACYCVASAAATWPGNKISRMAVNKWKHGKEPK